MILEKSCGAVIFTEEKGKPKFLVEKMRKGHFSHCKGHVEAGETEHDTARREIREETALEVDFIPGFRESISYSPYPGCMKEVVFFLARAHSTAVRAQEEEVAEIFWLEYGAALRALSFESDRQVLEKAMNFLGGENSF